MGGEGVGGGGALLPPLPHLGVVGLGLIGGSLALAAKAAGWRVSGYNRGAEGARAALEAGGIDRAVGEIGELGVCDVVFIAVPMRAYDAVLLALAGGLRDGAVITDGGSSKREAIAAARRCLPAAAVRRFVPAHPMAGKEESGWAAACAALFRGRLTLLCAEDGCAPEAVAAVTRLWEMAGARVRTMDAPRHDRLLAQVSHLPHLLSYALVSAIERRDDCAELLPLAAGGFRDFTRIAASHPHMWRDICLANAENILAALADYRRELAEFSDLIENQDGDGLARRFEAARALRRDWMATLES